MRSGAGDPHLVDVELVEDPPSRPRPGRSRAHPDRVGGSDGRSPRRSRPPRTWIAVGVVAVLAVAGWGLNRADARREEVQLAALAARPGYLDPIDEPLTQVWRIPAAEPVARSGHALLLARAGEGVVAAVDLRSGHRLWRRGPTAQECRGLPETVGPALPVVTVVVCLPDERDDGTAAGADEVADRTVEVLDPTTGRELHSSPLPAGTTAAVLADLVVLRSPTTHGAVTVRAWDPVTGTQPWSFTAGGDDPVAVQTGPGWSYLLADGVIELVSGDVRLTFDAGTGRGRTVGGGSPVERVELSGGREASWVRDRFGRPRDVVLVDRDAGTSVAAPGRPWAPVVSDGVANDVVVVRRTTDQHLVGLDARSGRVRWDLANVAWLEPAVQVGATVVAVSPASATALDVGTGLRLWDHPVARGSARWRVLTDGRVVLLPSEGGTVGALVARRLQTGEEVWRVPLPGAVVSVDEVDGRTVLVRTETALVALR